MHVDFRFGWALIASLGSIYERTKLNCSRWQNLSLQRPSGANKAGPFSPLKSPELAEMTDLQLRHWPNWDNYINIILLCSCSVWWGQRFPMLFMQRKSMSKKFGFWLMTTIICLHAGVSKLWHFWFKSCVQMLMSPELSFTPGIMRTHKWFTVERVP